MNDNHLSMLSFIESFGILQYNLIQSILTPWMVLIHVISTVRRYAELDCA